MRGNRNDVLASFDQSILLVGTESKFTYINSTTPIHAERVTKEMSVKTARDPNSFLLGENRKWGEKVSK